ncbi:MAG: hypothetical protein AAFR60_12640, partial [Pseudomonadota bacterium]
RDLRPPRLIRRPRACAARGFEVDKVVPLIDRVFRAYLDLRSRVEEPFFQAYRRLGAAPSKAVLYDSRNNDRAA